MSDKSDLKAELERKKQRLAQIREEKKRKEEERKKKEVRKNVSTATEPVFFRSWPGARGCRGSADCCLAVCVGQSDSQKKREATPEDSDLDRKRRETEALLQSIGISPEPSLGS